ncbi:MULTISPECIES: DUF3551 domain-containing protein [unclassified Bradyrhizobium]|jgi:hypothetical protein|uniref:DUF3551 domain-containing protein n=1 Tax=unclassified Bradyrhizobium TaxID=2631580 RepID=UPI00140DE5B1|nr:DUF3551 domain-containing protein [Bradyrhizobium sp. 2S1]MCK7672055.1 DUF3551 domain-containing protein [Bradyrhizobium sp. 2S1]
MRLKLFAIAACAVAAFGGVLAGPAAGQAYDPNYPVCMHVYGGRFGGNYIDCSFTSIPQCQASASGRGAMCSVNPFFAPQPPPKRRAHRGRHHRAY